MSTPACSVIIPTRDCLPYLPGTLASIQAQERDDLEILVVDDGSTDGSAAWLAAQAARDSRLRVLEAGGHGPSAARNCAIAAARSPLIAFLDADDTWRPGKLSAQIVFHQSHPDAVFSFTDYRHVDPEGRDLGTCFGFWPAFHRRVGSAPGYRPLSDAASVLLAENVAGTSTVMARRRALQDANGFATDLDSAEDWDLWLRLSRAGPVGFTDAVGTDYLMRPGSATGNAVARLNAVREIMRRHTAAAPVAPWALRHARARLLTGQAELARRQGRRAGALGRHVLALLHAPSLRALRAVAADAAGLLVSNRGRLGENP